MISGGAARLEQPIVKEKIDVRERHLGTKADEMHEKLAAQHRVLVDRPEKLVIV